MTSRSKMSSITSHQSSAVEPEYESSIMKLNKVVDSVDGTAEFEHSIQRLKDKAKDQDKQRIEDFKKKSPLQIVTDPDFFNEKNITSSQRLLDSVNDTSSGRKFGVMMDMLDIRKDNKSEEIVNRSKLESYAVGKTSPHSMSYKNILASPLKNQILSPFNQKSGIKPDLVSPGVIESPPPELNRIASNSLNPKTKLDLLGTPDLNRNTSKTKLDLLVTASPPNTTSPVHSSDYFRKSPSQNNSRSVFAPEVSNVNVEMPTLFTKIGKSISSAPSGRVNQFLDSLKAENAKIDIAPSSSEVLLPVNTPTHEDHDDQDLDDVKKSYNNRRASMNSTKSGKGKRRSFDSTGVNNNKKLSKLFQMDEIATPIENPSSGIDHNSPFLFYWNIWILLIVAYKFYLVPFRSAFLSGQVILAFIIIDAIGDISFMIDIYLTSITTIFDRGFIITDIEDIRRIYFFSFKYCVDVMG